LPRWVTLLPGLCPGSSHLLIFTLLLLTARVLCSLCCTPPTFTPPHHPHLLHSTCLLFCRLVLVACWLLLSRCLCCAARLLLRCFCAFSLLYLTTLETVQHHAALWLAECCACHMAQFDPRPPFTCTTLTPRIYMDIRYLCSAVWTTFTSTLLALLSTTTTILLTCLRWFAAIHACTCSLARRASNLSARFLTFTKNLPMYLLPLLIGIPWTIYLAISDKLHIWRTRHRTMRPRRQRHHRLRRPQSFISPAFVPMDEDSNNDHRHDDYFIYSHWRFFTLMSSIQVSCPFNLASFLFHRTALRFLLKVPLWAPSPRQLHEMHKFPCTHRSRRAPITRWKAFQTIRSKALWLCLLTVGAEASQFHTAYLTRTSTATSLPSSPLSSPDLPPTHCNHCAHLACALQHQLHISTLTSRLPVPFSTSPRQFHPTWHLRATQRNHSIHALHGNTTEFKAYAWNATVHPDHPNYTCYAIYLFYLSKRPSPRAQLNSGAQGQLNWVQLTPERGQPTSQASTYVSEPNNTQPHPPLGHALTSVQEHVLHTSTPPLPSTCQAVTSVIVHRTFPPLPTTSTEVATYVASSSTNLHLPSTCHAATYVTAHPHTQCVDLAHAIAADLFDTFTLLAGPLPAIMLWSLDRLLRNRLAHALRGNG